MFNVLDQLDEEYPTFAFGRNKEGELFVNAQKTGIVLNEKTTYKKLEKLLLKNKFIKVIIEEEE